MVSHQLAIAKASFSAGLLRPDPTSISRDSIAHFHTLLNAAIIQCSPANIQKCKHWILEHIAGSTGRFGGLGKYLVVLSSSFDKGAGQEGREPSVKRKRLHLLFLVNDILHHAKFHNNDASVCGKVQPILVSLVGSAASFKGCPKHQGKIMDLLGIWEEKGYYSKEYIDKLRETARNAAEGGDFMEAGENDQSAIKVTKATPFVMPAMHGDTSMPWFDLPAGNLMPHIVPNSTRPINPGMVKPLQFVAGPAEEGLVAAVKALLDDVQVIFGGGGDQDEKEIWDVDELGQPIILDEITGDVIDGEGYYGWSRNFCEKMKRRKKELDMPDLGEGRGRSRSSSRDTRKRRYGGSDDESSRDRSRRRRRSYSSSRSPTPDRDRNGHSRGNSRRISYSRSPTPPKQMDSFPRPQPPVPQNSQVFLNQPPLPMLYQQQRFNPNFPPQPPLPPPVHNMPQIPPFNSQQNPQFGSWPPPPPPNLPHSNPLQPWPPPPPPGALPINFQTPQYPPSSGTEGYPSGPGGWQQQQGGDGRGYAPPGPGAGGYAAPAGPGGWQQQQQGGDGRGAWNGNRNDNGNGWNSGQSNWGRGGFRGRGRGW